MNIASVTAAAAVAAIFLSATSLSGCAAGAGIAAGPMGSVLAQSAGVPQLDALLPHKDTVPPTAPMPLDGFYTVSTIGKTIRIEGGRAYVVDAWLHALTLRVKPDMVVLQNIRPIGNGMYEADDLPLLGKATFQPVGNGTFAVTVQGMTGVVRYNLVPEANYPIDQSVSQPAVPSPQVPYEGGGDDLETCSTILVDEVTLELVCADL